MKIFTPFRVVLLALIVGISGAILMAMRQPPPPPPEQLAEAPSPQAPTSQPAIVLAPGDKHTTPSGLTIVEVKEGSGAAAKAGDQVSVHYTGRLYYGGQKFDSSYDRGDPLHFAAGQGNVIKGFDEGVLGLKVGGKRELIIPPDIGYGDAGAGDKIPPGATLVFDIELMGIQ